MSYTINNSDGTLLANIAPGTSDSTTTSLTLVGKNFPGYGQFLNENFVQLLENFASSNEPANPQEGQLWWDKANGTNKVLKIYMGDASWKRICGGTSDSIAPDARHPGSSAVGDIWWDTTNAQLKVYNGNDWTTVGPAFTTTTGQSGALADVLSDIDGNQHVIVKILIDNTWAAVLSKTTFVAASGVSGFTDSYRFEPGINLPDDAEAEYRYWGVADNAAQLGGTPAVQFAKLNGTDPFTTAQVIDNNNGLTIGASNDLTLTAAAGMARISSIINSNDLAFYANVSGNQTKMLTLGTGGARVFAHTSNGTPTVFSTASDHNIANKKYVDDAIVNLGLGGSGGNTTFNANLVPTANASVSGTGFNLGSPDKWWDNIYGTAIHARYADVAERFEADKPILPGTVVELGGAKEITAVAQELSENILGVISTNAAYLMNSGAGSDLTHPPVAVSGRVPVRVIGTIRKGDRLVSAGNGLARAGARTEISPWNVIGRALTSKSTPGEGIIEATVKLNS